MSQSPDLEVSPENYSPENFSPESINQPALFTHESFKQETPLQTEDEITRTRENDVTVSKI